MTLLHFHGRTTLLFTSATALCVMTASPVSAQDAVASQPAAPDNAGDAANGEIVVTAQKRTQSLNKVSVAVTALSQEQMQTAGIKTVTDLTSTAPNVQIHSVGPVGYSGVSIRGVTNQNFTQLGSPAVATYVDGIYAAVSQSVAGGLYDIERIEILRGPQGTTYGQNATGGNVNIITAAPVHSFGGSADVSYERFNEVTAHATINLPVSDQLAMRAAIMIRRSDGYFDTEGTTARNYGASDEFGGRLSILWTPSSNFKWRLTGEVFRNDGAPSNMLMQIGADRKPANGRSPYSQPFAGQYPEPDIDLTTYSLRSRMEWDITDNLNLSYVAGYQHQKSSYVFAIAGAGNLAVYDSQWLDKVNSYSNEIILSYDAGRLQTIFGASQFHKDNPYSNAFHFNAINLDQYRNGAARQSTAGVFGQATYSVLDAVRLIGGLRWSRESQDNERATVTVNCPVVAGSRRSYDQIRDFGAQNASIATCTTSPVPYAQGVWKNVSWKGGLEWDLAPRSMAYLSVTNGFKSGQVQPGLPALFAPYVDPEELLNYEAGLKVRLLDNALNIRTAAFYMNYKDIQVTAVTLINNFSYIFTQNAAKAKIYGIESEWQYQVTPQDNISGFLAYTHATYGDYANAVDGQTGRPVAGNLRGNHLASAPEWSAQADYSHRFDLSKGGKITPAISFYYQSKSYLREFNYFIDKIDGYTKTSLTLSYEDPSGRWTTSAYVHNLEDNAIRNSANTALGRYFSDYYAPRTWGIRAGYRF